MKLSGFLKWPADGQGNPELLLPMRVCGVHAGTMGAGKPADRKANGQQARENHDAREYAADERQERADEREHQANERDSQADERERQADEREARADERERQADERERLADEREQNLEERGQSLGRAIDDLEQRTRATIERSRALLVRSGKKLDRQEEQLTRSHERRDRQQAEINRASAETERGLTAQMPDSDAILKRSRQLRTQALTTIEAFAASEEQVARVHEELAASRPNQRQEYRRVAEQARATARRAREILSAMTAGPPDD